MDLLDEHMTKRQRNFIRLNVSLGSEKLRAVHGTTRMPHYVVVSTPATGPEPIGKDATGKTMYRTDSQGNIVYELKTMQRIKEFADDHVLVIGYDWKGPSHFCADDAKQIQRACLGNNLGKEAITRYQYNMVLLLPWTSKGDRPHDRGSTSQSTYALY